MSGGKIVVDVHQIENFSEDATLAERTYGIEPRSVTSINNGVRGSEEVFFGVAFSSGLDKVVIPFIDRGIPVEYELVRSICTVAGQQRKKLGVLKTDAQLFGGFSMQGPTEESQIITELKKQYDVAEVDPAKPITQEVRRAAGRAALVALARGDGQLRRSASSRASRPRSSRIPCPGSTRSAASSAPASPSSRPAA